MMVCDDGDDDYYDNDDDDNDSNDYGDWVLDRVSAMRLINPCKSRPPRKNVKKSIGVIDTKFII